ncbi:hypothetical protein AVEN_76183-1 [Araneus ventricosus]|uniref:Uncharacterized protein n=1 Tax=Araneus ventricosus TaxID=182803 RepID=A0A4Y2EX66_ARAVE|nr:hypothetical protein AVEN_76183-1 [Araneus ventricosus]
MQLYMLFGGQSLVVLFHKLIDIIAIHLQSPDLGQRHNLVDYRLHGVLSQTSQCDIRQHSPAKASSRQKFAVSCSKSKTMKYLGFLVIFALVASAYAAMDMAQFAEHFIAVGCTKTASSGTTLPMKICGSCLNYTVDVRKIDQGSCANLQG